MEEGTHHEQVRNCHGCGTWLGRVCALASAGTAGATVIHTARGDDALHRVKGCDLVLLDLGLPDMDGLDVLRTLRRASAVPVIMTARDSGGAVVLGLRAGADDYLSNRSERRCY
jgi:DNA-binding response OmpR family regulator